MNQFLELLISGLSLGCIYALIAMGFVIVFKATNVVNFAHVSVLMLGAYLVARWHEALGFFGAVAVAAVACAVVAAAARPRVRAPAAPPRRRRRRARDPHDRHQHRARDRADAPVGTDLLPTGAPWGSDVVARPRRRGPADARRGRGRGDRADGRRSGRAFKFTDWGVALRSAAADREAAALMGIRLTAWPRAPGRWPARSPRSAARSSRASRRGREQRDRPARADRLPGGGRSAAWTRSAGAVVGGLIIGVATTFAAGYQDDIVVPRPRAVRVMPYVVLVLVLLWRPSGLFGTREITPCLIAAG